MCKSNAYPKHVTYKDHFPLVPIGRSLYTLAGIPGSPAAIYHFLMDAAGQAVQSCRVQSEGVKDESKGLQETGLPAIYTFDCTYGTFALEHESI